ncbi:hypothetical protein PFISCL1PPCAC_5605 [Pristionchus fissidentatus]|uniref:Ribosomal protein n=1 Tax=Pristionchus fissidentatus TaxID=1538716 RepID=A0AAV5V7U9_9BILA|nr:hypothetical protein PFISCL1PPCAC_5605 [Pristionchus fissidentatus]
MILESTIDTLIHILGRFKTLLEVLGHIGFALSFELSVIFSGGLLVLLVLGDEIIHIALSLRELHLVHTLSGVPMEESLAAEHGAELLRDSLEELLDGSRVSDKGGGHLQATGRNVTDGSLDVGRDPIDEVRRVLVLDGHHLVIDLTHRHASTEHGSHSKVTSVTRVASSHHVLGVEHLLGQLSNGQGVVSLRALGRQGSESRHEEVKTREGNHVDGQLAEISIELTRESQAGRNSRHGHRHKMVEISIVGVGKFQGAETDLVEGFVVNTESLVGVLHELVDRESGIVGLDDSVRNLKRGNDGERAHDSIGVLLADLGYQESSHSRSSSTSEGMSELEALKAIASLSLLSDHIEDLIDELSAFSVVSLGPVVSGSTLSEDEVIGTEDLSVCRRANRVHSSGLEIDENCTGNVLSSVRLIVVNVDSLELEVRLSTV